MKRNHKNALCALVVFLGMTPVASAIQANCLDVVATVSATPTPQVTFSWDAQKTGVSIGIYRRVMGAVGASASWWLRGTVAYPTATFTDSIAAGTTYEYKVYRSFLDATTSPASAFVSVALNAPVVHARGKILLVVDQTQTAALAGELALLEMDLVGDGWTVQRIDSARHGSGTPAALRVAIKAAYTADSNIKAVYLFGHLPIPMSGWDAPDGHANKPQDADGFYGDMTGTWTDTSNLGTGNVPSDGIYDQNYFPSKLSLMVGRVDFAGMGSFHKSETEYLRDYIHKSHAFRHGQRTEVTRTALMGSQRYLWQEYNWLLPMFGSGKMTMATFQPTLATATHLFGADFGTPAGSDPNYVATPNKLIFAINFGSYKLYYDLADNAMRALLAQPDWGLTCVWGSRPAWFFHHMGAGLPVGYSALQTMNNWSGNPDYFPSGDYASQAGNVQESLMGDPTLRLHPVAPPENVTVAKSGASAVVSWKASPDAAVGGYNVYSSSNRLGPYTLLTAQPLAGTVTIYMDPAPAAGDVFYQVRALKTEVTAAAIYSNLSQGAFAKLNPNGTGNQAPTAQSGSLVAPSGQQPSVTFTGADPDGETLIPIVLTNPSLGELRWTGSAARYVPKAGTSGIDTIRYVMSDGVTASAPATITVDATPAGFVKLATTTMKVSKTVGTAQIGVERSGGRAGAITLTYTVANSSAIAGTHFTAPSGTLSWADGETGIKNISVPITNTATPQQTRQFRVTLSSVTGGASIGVFNKIAVLIEDPAAALPAPWSQTIVGPTSVTDFSPAAQAESALGSVTMGGVGCDVSATVDGGQFIYQPRTGDGVLTAFVPASVPEQSTARFAVMIRDSTNSTSIMAATAIGTSSGSFGTKGLTRTTSGAAAVQTGMAASQETPGWIRITRAGNTFTSESSADGAVWTTLGCANVTMSATAQWGLFHLSVAPAAANGSTPIGYGDYQLAMFQNVAMGSVPLAAAPGSFVLTMPTSTSVKLTWAASAFAAGYRIERCTETGDFALLADIPSGLTLSYTDSTVAAASTYQYRIVAYNDSGASAPSSALGAATPEALNPLLRPGFLTTAPGNGSSIALTWMDNSANESGFQIERRTANGAWTLVATTPANSTSYIDADALPGVIYEYRIRAMSATGYSSWANVAGLKYVGVAKIDGPAWSADGVVFDVDTTSPGNAFVPPSFLYDPPAISFVTGQTLGTVQTAMNGWYGMKIAVGSTPIWIRELGRWVVSGNTGIHAVKLVDATTGVDVPGGSIAVDTSGAPVGFRYASLAAPVALAANTAYYVVSQEYEEDSFYNGNCTLTTSSAATVTNSVGNNNGIDVRIDFESPNYAVGNAYLANGTANTLPVAGPALHRFTRAFVNASDVWTATVETAGATGNRLLIASLGNSTLSNNSGFEVRTNMLGANSGTWYAQMDYTRLTTSGGPLVSLRMLNSGGSVVLGHPNNALLYADKWAGVSLAVGSTHTLRVELDVVTGIWRQYLDGALVNTVAATSTNITFGGIQLAFWGSTYSGSVCAFDNIVVGKVAATPNDLYSTSILGSKSYGPVAFRYSFGANPFVNGHSMTSLRNDYTGWLGMKFTVGSADIAVSQLGRWVAPGNTGTHTVKLVNAATGADVASASVSTLGATSGQFKHTPLSTAVTLTANTSFYLLSQETAGGDQWYDFSFAASGTPTGYQSWLLANGLPMDASGAGSATANPASDGLSNLLKYALGLSPDISGHGGRLGSGTVTDSKNRYLSLTYTRPEPAPSGITYSVEAASDITSWTSSGVMETGNFVADGLRTITLRDAVPLSGSPKRFMHLKVSKP